MRNYRSCLHIQPSRLEHYPLIIFPYWTLSKKNMQGQGMLDQPNTFENLCIRYTSVAICPKQYSVLRTWTIEKRHPSQIQPCCGSIICHIMFVSQNVKHSLVHNLLLTAWDPKRSTVHVWAFLHATPTFNWTRMHCPCKCNTRERQHSHTTCLKRKYTT